MTKKSSKIDESLKWIDVSIDKGKITYVTFPDCCPYLLKIRDYDVKRSGKNLSKIIKDKDGKDHIVHTFVPLSILDGTYKATKANKMRRKNHQ